jgi:uracil-DNA glycosylase
MDSGTGTVGTALPYSREDHVHPIDTSRAPLASPTFTGDPKAPTPSPGDNDTSIATTAFVAAAITAAGAPAPATVAPLIDNVTAVIGVATKYAREDHVHPLSYTAAALTRVDDTNVTLVLGGTPATALLKAASITAGWTGTLSTTRGGFGANNGSANGVPLFATGVVTMTSTTGTGNFARAADPVFTGNPQAPTATAGDNDTTIATTAFVTTAVAAVPAAPAPATVAPLIDNAALVGVATKYAREDHVHPISYTAAALTKTDDTNVTLTLGGTPATALLKASSITAGWTGTLSTTRGGLGLNAGASNGLPLFASGAVTMTATTGTGNIARDSTVPLPATATPIMDAAGTVGTTTKYAREDHIHPKSWTQLTQAAYDALTPPNANMLYVIVG